MFLDASATDVCELLLLAYFALLLGCAIRFTVKIGAFSPHRYQRPTADYALSDSSLL